MSTAAWRLLGAGVFGLGLVVGATLPGGSAHPASAEPAEPLAPPISAAVAQAGDQDVLRMLLDGMAGADPVACELALMALDGRAFSWSSVRADIERASPGGMPARRLAEWIMSPPRGDPAVVPPLRTALASADPCTRRTAARMLGRIRTATAVAALLDALDAAAPPVRHAAVVGLGMAEDTATGPRLRGALEDPDAAVRAAAAWALGEIEDAAATADLIRALQRDDDATVRKAAAWALGRIE